AIGDLAVDHAVRGIVEAMDAYGRRSIPNRIEHAGTVHDEHLATLAEYGIAVTPQASFARDIGDGMNSSVGEERRHLLYRGRSFVDAGVMLAGSSDRPCSDGNALRGIQAFVDRLTSTGYVMGAAEERLTAEQAVTAYTRTAAQASGHGAVKGTLTRGRLPDLVLLGEDPMRVDPSTIRDSHEVETLADERLAHTTL